MVPTVDPERTLPLYRALSRAMENGLVHSAGTPAKGGLAVALARCAMAGNLGAELDLSGVGNLPEDVLLFSESNGRFVVTVPENRAAEFEKEFRDLPCHLVGKVTADQRLNFPNFSVTVAAMKAAYKEALSNV
jgi:phosphoribosylformylglycinamidine synthase